MKYRPFGYGRWCYQGPFQDQQRTVRWERQADGTINVKRYYLLGDGLFMGKYKIKWEAK